MEYNLDNEADSIIKTLQSFEGLEGKIDYNENEKIFQSRVVITTLATSFLGSWMGEAGYTHTKIVKGLDDLKEKIVSLQKHIDTMSGAPEQLELLKGKIETIQDLFLKANSILQNKVLYSYKQAAISEAPLTEKEKAVTIELTINNLTKTFMKSMGVINQKINPKIKQYEPLESEERKLNAPKDYTPTDRSTLSEEDEWQGVPPPTDIPLTVEQYYLSRGWNLPSDQQSLPIAPSESQYPLSERISTENQPLSDVSVIALNTLSSQTIPRSSKISENRTSPERTLNIEDETVTTSEISTKSKPQSKIGEPIEISISSSTLPETSYEFPLSEKEAKLLESEKNPKAGDLFAGRIEVNLKGILNDYQEKLEAFEENFQLYNEAKEKEKLYKENYEKLAPPIPNPIKTALGDSPTSRGGPVPRGGSIPRGGSVPQTQTTEEKERVQKEKNEVFNHYNKSKTQLINSGKKLMELLFPNENPSVMTMKFDFSTLKEYRDFYIAKTKEKILAYELEMINLRTKKTQSPKTIQSAESIEQKNLEALSKKIINFQGSINTLNKSRIRLENEKKRLPSDIGKKQDASIAIDPNAKDASEKHEKLSNEITALKSRMVEIPKELENNKKLSDTAQNNLNIAISNLQKALNTQENDSKALLKMAEDRINELKG